MGATYRGRHSSEFGLAVQTNPTMLPPISLNTIDVPGRPGSYLVGSKYGIRTIPLKISFIADDLRDYESRLRALADWLRPDLGVGEYISDNEPDKVYYAVLSDQDIQRLDNIARIGQGTLTLVAPDPYAYGPTRTQTIAVPPASFSRNSVAYLSDSTQVAANQPRFENGGVLIEEGTTNLLTANQASVETDLSGIVANYPSDVTITRDTTVAWQGSASAKVSCSVSTDYRGVRIGPISLTGGKTYTFSAYVRGLNGGEKVRLAVTSFKRVTLKGAADTSDATLKWAHTSDVTLTTNFQRLTLTWACDATGSYYLEIGQFGNSSPVTFYYDGGQVEEKPYVSSFVDGTRQPETLTLPTSSILLPDEGTIEIELEIPYITNYNNFFSMSTNNGRFLLFFDKNGKVSFDDGPNNSGISSASGVIQANTKTTISLRWSKSLNKLTLFVNGNKYEKSLPNGVADSFPDSVSVVNNYSAKLYNLRISRIARTDAEILDTYQNGFKVDEYTTAYMDFEGNLNVQAPTVVTNEGTAETYPVLTAQILKPITFLQIVSPDSYMQIGQPVAVKQTSGVKEENIFHDAMESLTGWGATTTIAEGYAKGSIIQSGGGFKAGDFGQTDPYTPDWQGPALKKSLNQATSGDFRVEAWLFHLTQAGTTGRIEIDALDAANNIIARMFLEDKWIGLERLGGQLQLGGVASPATEYIKLPGKLEQFNGRIRMERRGNEWTFSILQHAENSSNVVKTWSATYKDKDGSHNQAIAQLQVVFQKYHDTAPDNMEIYSLRAWKHNDIGDQVAYIADVDDVIEFDHSSAVIRKNGEVWMTEKDFGASFFPIGKGETELAVNPSDAAIVTIEYRPRWL